MPSNGNVSLTELTATMRSKSTSNHASVAAASACQNVAAFPSLAKLPLWPGASLLARVGLFKPKVRSGAPAAVLLNRTYGRGFTDGVLPATNFGSPREVIAIVASFKLGEVARIS